MILYIYFFLIIIVLYIIYSSYLKFRFPFWSRQPVFHYHYLTYYFNTERHIYKNAKDMNLFKYLNTEKTKIFELNDVSSFASNKNLIEIYFSLIQKYYLNNKISKFIPSFEYLYNIINSNISYVALYTDIQALRFKNKIIKRENVISGLTSKQLILHRPSQEISSNLRNLKIHYVDFLCTHIKNRKQNITPKLIYTYAKHVMNIDDSNNKQSIFIFKREGETQSFVPFTVYNNFVFDLKYFIVNMKQNIVPKTIRIEHIKIDTFIIFARIFETIKERINILHVELETIKHYIDKQIIDVYVAFENNNPIAIYIYKNNCFYYNSKPIFELISSYNIENTNFFDSIFEETVHLLIKSKQIGYLTIENLSNNNVLIKHMRDKNNECYRYMNSFYLYNYVLNTTSSNSLLTIL